MQSPLRLQIPAHTPPHAVWHAYSLRLKASEKHQISRHNTEKILPCCKEGRNGRKEAVLCAQRRNRNIVFSKWTFTKTNQAGIHQINPYLWPGTDVEISSLLQTLSSATACPHHAHCPSPHTERCSHLVPGKAETPGSHMTHGKC